MSGRPNDKEPVLRNWMKVLGFRDAKKENPLEGACLVYSEERKKADSWQDVSQCARRDRVAVPPWICFTAEFRFVYLEYFAEGSDMVWFTFLKDHPNYLAGTMWWENLVII